MTGININFSPNEYEYSYTQSGNTGTQVHNTVNVYPKAEAGKDYFVNISSKSNNQTATGGMPFNTPKAKGNIGKKFIKGLKYCMGGVRPGQVMMLGLMAFIFAARTAPSSPSGNNARTQQATEQAYKLGEQHIRDSIKTAQLEEQLKLAQDSIKLLKKMPK